MYEGFLTDLECDHLISLVSAHYSNSELNCEIFSLFNVLIFSF